MNTANNYDRHIKRILQSRLRIIFACFSIILISIVCIKSTFGQSSLAGLPFVRNFSPVEYRAGIQNWAIAQDKRGLMLFANNYGLLEYDGNTWRTYGVPNGSKMRSLAIAEDGRIYVGCQGDFGFFFPDQHGGLVYTSLAVDLPSQYRNFDETWNVFIDQQRIYFCTFTRIFSYSNEKFTIIESDHALELSFYQNRQLYTFQKDKGLTKLVGDSLHMIQAGDFFSYRSVSSVLQQSRDALLISTFQDGLYELKDGKITIWNERQQQYFKEANVNCMLHLKNGNLAVGTQNNGLLLLNSEGDLLLQLTSGKGLQNRTVLSLYEDDEGNLWVGQNNGIAYVELGSPFSLWNEENGLPGSGYAVYLDHDFFYLGTSTGLYAKSLKEPLASLKLVENTRGQVYHINRYGGDLLMGHHTGTYRIEGVNSTRISSEPGAWTFISTKEAASKLIGGTYAGLQQFEMNGAHWRFNQKFEGFTESSRVMTQASFNEIWVTHGYKGAFKIQFHEDGNRIEKINFYGVNKGFPSNNLINVLSLRNDLVFTSERGVFRYQQESDRFIPDVFFTKLLGPNAQIWAMQEDVFGNIYFIGRDKIGVLKKNATGEYVEETNAFNRIRVLLNDDLENLHILQNNEVLFGAKEGFVHYDPLKVKPNPTNFNAMIRFVSTINQHRDSILFLGNHTSENRVVEEQRNDVKIELPYTHNSLMFRFAATSYEGNNIHYQYYLDTYEADWSEWNALAQKEYTNLKEGKYVFHVRARNAQGILSEQATYTFYILAPWFRSTWAYGLYMLLGMAILGIGYSFLDRKYQRQQKLLLLKQENELNEKDTEIEKLSLQTHAEISRLHHEKMETELNHKNSELASATMHLLNKNEFIAGIKTDLNLIAKKSKQDDLTKELLHISKDIEHNISNDSDWEQFQFHFDRVHGDFSNRFKRIHPSLSPQEIKLSAYLRMNLSTKEIAQLLHISVRGVEIGRYRLRKKLLLDRSKNLQDYILNF